MGDNTLNAYLRCGVVYYNKDIYTDVTQGDAEAIPHMAYGCDIDTLVHTEDGKVNLSPFNNEKNVSVMDKRIALIHETTGVYESDKSIDSSPVYFAENNSLFYSGRLSNAAAAAMREMESDYGILPMPKYDADQKNYVTFIHNAAVVTCMPKTVADNRINMVGAVLEGLAAESYRTVITPFIETALKRKYSATLCPVRLSTSSLKIRPSASWICTTTSTVSTTPSSPATSTTAPTTSLPPLPR